MEKKSTHVVLLIRKNGYGEYKGIDTIDEHIRVAEYNGRVVWGFFSGNPYLKGFWEVKIGRLATQSDSGEDAFVFFLDKASEVLYVGKYISHYSKDDFERTNINIKLIPEYYRFRIGGSKSEGGHTLSAYAYIEVENLKALKYTDARKIFSENREGESILEYMGMSSKYYVNIDAELADYINALYDNESRVPLGGECSIFESDVISK